MTASNHDLATLLASLTQLETENGSLVLWHRTPAAVAILARGWQDGGNDEGLRSALATPELGNGVYVSNRPLGGDEGAKGADVLRILLEVAETEIAAFEVVEESGESTYREWCLPAALLNGRGQTSLHNV